MEDLVMLDKWQRIVFEWGRRAFGEDHMRDKQVRALRLVEEAIEYAQACGVPEEKIGACKNLVYSRPVGAAFQELGGVLVTALAAASSQYYKAEEVLEEEILRVLSKPPEHFAKRNEEKIDAGLR